VVRGSASLPHLRLVVTRANIDSGSKPTSPVAANGDGNSGVASGVPHTMAGRPWRFLGCTHCDGLEKLAVPCAVTMYQAPSASEPGDDPLTDPFFGWCVWLRSK